MYKTGWEYEPMILLITSMIGFSFSIILLIINQSSSNEDNNISYLEEQEESKVILLPTDIEPKAIREQIKAAPLFQQVEVANHFNGLLVQWVLKLSIISRVQGNQIRVVMSHNDNIFPQISFETDVDIYPTLRIAKDEKQFIVVGKIIKCELLGIELSLVSLEELP